MDEIIVRGMHAVLERINLSTGFVHPTDKGCTIEMLRESYIRKVYIGIRYNM